MLKSSNDNEMAKAIREADGKALLFQYFRTQGLWKDLVAPFKCATVTPDVDVNKLVEDHPWLGREVHLRDVFVMIVAHHTSAKGRSSSLFGITSSNSNSIGPNTCTVKIMKTVYSIQTTCAVSK